MGKEDLDSVAHCFGKVSIETCKKFYGQLFSNMEAALQSWKCINLFSISDNNSNINEIIRVALSFFFHDNISQVRKGTKRH